MQTSQATAPPQFKALTRMKAFDPIYRARCNQHSYPEDPEFKAVLSDAQTDMRAYDTEIARLQNTIDFLQSEKAALAHYVGVCGSLKSPARRLPRDLLLHIFQYIQSQVWIQCFSGGATFMPPAMSLASVNHYWHDVVAGAPQLWTNVLLELLSSTNDTRHVKGWLEGLASRAKSMFITLELDIHPHAFSTSPDEADLLYTSLKGIMPRVRSIRCGSVFSKIIPSSPMLSLESFTLLPLSISHNDGWSHDRMDLSRLAPNLTKLRVHSQPFIPLIPYANITELHFTKISLSLTTSALQRCTSLKTLVLGSLIGDTQNLEALTVTLPELSHLVLADCGLPFYNGVVDAVSILSTLSLPKLYSLVLKDNVPMLSKDARAPQSRFPEVANLIARSQCKLLHFSCDGGQSLCISDLMSFLSSQSGIQRLSLGYPDIDADSGGLDPLLLFLSHGQPSSGIHPSNHLPQLVALHVTAPRKAFEDHKFVELVKSRWRPQDAVHPYARDGVLPAACLQSVELVVRKGKFTDELWEPLHRRQMHGLRVSVRDRRGCMRTRWEQLSSERTSDN